MRNTLNTVALLIFAAIPVAHAQEKAEFIHTVGSTDCGMWVKARKLDRALALEHYLLGLVNGMSLGSRVEFWNASGSKISSEQVYLWMDNYCATNPLNDVLQGGLTLMDEHTNGAYRKATR